MQYEKAIMIDKRTFLKYYISILQRKQLLLFTFYTNSDYNLISMKISLFLFSFALNYAVNTLFFTDDSMHKIYEDKGKYNILYQITNILYSSLISNIIINLFEYLGLTEDNIKEINKSLKYLEFMKLKRCIKIKFIFYYILNFLFLLLFWYYLSCFGAVYKNSQIHVFKDSLFSFGISLSYPIIVNLLPSAFRIIALRENNKTLKCLYKISQILENVNIFICC